MDANILYYLGTFVGDLAVADGRLADALEPYARSLEHALADGNLTQVGLDLVRVAEALAALGHDAEALEVAGTAESQSAELGASSDTLYDEHLRALEQRVGPNKATALEQHARAASPADRVARACQLARSHALPPRSRASERSKAFGTMLFLCTCVSVRRPNWRRGASFGSAWWTWKRRLTIRPDVCEMSEGTRALAARRGMDDLCLSYLQPRILSL